VRKRTKEALQASEIRYRRLFEAAQDGILILDFATGQIVDANPFLTNLLGYSHAELVGKDVWEIGPVKDISHSRLSFADLQAKGIIRYDDLPLETLR
jgi:PAS domain S-box-containing protein